MELIWGTPGKSLFDLYSIQHFVWFFAVTVALACVMKRRLVFWAAGIVVGWEAFEGFVVRYASSFPFAGWEEWPNWLVGDTISDAAGFFLAIAAVRYLKRQGRIDVGQSDMW